MLYAVIFTVAKHNKQVMADAQTARAAYSKRYRLRNNNMEQILKNLADPSWWFTGIFFIVVGIILTKLVINWVPSLWCKLSTYFPKRLDNFNRWNKKRVLLVIKNSRQKDMTVVWLIGRYWSSAIVSALLLALLLVYFSLLQDITAKEFLTSDQIFILIPFYGLMLSVASNKKTISRVVNAHHRWKRITRRSK